MNNVLTIDEMKNMSIDNIVNLYRYGYTIEENTINSMNNLDQKIVSADVMVSTGSLLLIGLGIFAYIYLKK